ncbi:MAG: PQQ-like beta-propeller repeat protein, partial [Anaerolineae bacterium]|nr:PQQ-like beta-propeller repeat protein [Anaerolineae bacterium]
NKDNGSLIWQYPSKSSQPLGPILYSAAYKDGKVFFAANDNYGYALDASNGDLLWKSDKMPGDGYQAWWPVVYGDYVIFSSAPAYVSEGDPGVESVSDVIAQNDPYYAQMYNFQYGSDFVKTLQRDDVFHQGEPDSAKLGPSFTSGGVGDSTGIQWSWGNGKSVVDASKVTEYLEDDGQAKVNRSTNKPWRRGVIALNISNGAEYTFDSDNDGRPEYAPFMFVGTKSGNRYPPLVIPQGINGQIRDVLYAQNFYQYEADWGISRARLTGWQFGTQYVFPVGDTNAVDEPFANSAGGSILYSNLCCDRTGSWSNLETGDGGSFWNYHKTLESVKLDWGDIESYQKSLAPGYDEMWWDSSMWLAYPRLFGNYGTINGIYHNHTIQNPLIPYKGRLFVHRSNAIIAFGSNATSLRQMAQNETPEQYEANIKQEYPNIAKPLLRINAPDQDLPPVLNLDDIQTKLDREISKMLQTGHLSPGYYNGTLGHTELGNYFENPGDTLYTLTQAYPYVSDNIKVDLEKYIKQHYKRYFEDNLYARTGFWIDKPTTYDLNNINAFGQLQTRAWMPLPPEVALDIQGHKASTQVVYGWPWSYPQHNIYAMWLFADTFYQNDQAKLDNIYSKAKSKLQTAAPDDETLHDKPWIHNAFIAGYTGFLNLQELANKTGSDASLRATIETELNRLLALRSNDFRKDQPWVGDKSEEGKIYNRSFNVARNFINMTPELGDYLHNNALNKVETAVDEYNWVAPYWVATRYEATQGEFSSDNLYTHPAMFQAKAYILQEPAEQLMKYIDSPAFETGDLFYIQNLVAILKNPGYGFKLDIAPSNQSIDTGESASFDIKIMPTGGFTKTISLNASSPSGDVQVSLNTQNIVPPGQATMMVTDLHDKDSLTSGLWYTFPIIAIGDDIVRSSNINLLVNAQKTYIPFSLTNN